MVTPHEREALRVAGELERGPLLAASRGSYIRAHVAAVGVADDSDLRWLLRRAGLNEPDVVDALARVHAAIAAADQGDR